MASRKAPKEYPLKQVAQMRHPRNTAPFDCWPIAFYNDGYHLYALFPEDKPVSKPFYRKLLWLPYDEYQGGAEFNGVCITHKGHFRNKRCLVNIQIHCLSCNYGIPPHKVLWIREHPRSVYVYLGGDILY
jgi:hypothetical protein